MTSILDLEGTLDQIFTPEKLIVLQHHSLVPDLAKPNNILALNLVRWLTSLFSKDK